MNVRRHLWLVEDPDHPTPLGIFLAGMPGPFTRDTDWHPQLALNAATVGFDRMVACCIKDAGRAQELCALIAQNPHRLACAANRLAVIAPWAPTLSDAELQAADITLKLPVTDANPVRASEVQS